MSKEYIHILVSGHVQGVFFRASTCDKARELDLTGWVRNLSDGSVEIVAEGEKINLEEFAVWAQQGPTSARVKNIDVFYEPYQARFNIFQIR